MRLITIKLENFQRFQKLDVRLDGRDAAIIGQNETGKSTIANAITWVLTDKPYTDEPGYTPKSIKGKDFAHNLDHSATLIYELENGRQIELKKTLRETWTKKRGSTTAEMTGHTTSYWIDDLPLAMKDYNSRIAELFGDSETIQLLTRPDFFSSAMPWAKRRHLLLDICGDISDEDVVRSDKDLQPLLELIADRTIDEISQIARQRAKKCNDELQLLPARIDEALRSIPADLPDEEDLEERIRKAVSALKSMRQELAGLSTTAGASDELMGQLKAARRAYSDAREQHESAERKAKLDHKARRRELEDVIDEIKARLRREKWSFEQTTTERDNIAARRQKLVEEIEALVASRYTGETVCPVCKQDLPADQVEASIAAWNEQRAKKIERLTEEGKQRYSAAAIRELQAKIDEIAEAINALKRELTEAEMRLSEHLDERVETVPFELTPEETPLRESVERLDRLVEEANADDPVIVEARGTMEEKIRKEEEYLGELQRLQQQKDLAARQKERVSELEAREKELATEFEAQQKTVRLCETFVQRKAELLTDSINSRFKHLRFRLFVEQINGGLKEDCEVLIPSETGNLVPYKSANTGGRILAGVEIIGVLGEYFGCHLPIVIDNAESVTNPIRTSAQVIRLIARPDTPELIIELDESRESEAA